MKSAFESLRTWSVFHGDSYLQPWVRWGHCLGNTSPMEGTASRDCPCEGAQGVRFKGGDDVRLGDPIPCPSCFLRRIQSQLMGQAGEGSSEIGVGVSPTCQALPRPQLTMVKQTLWMGAVMLWSWRAMDTLALRIFLRALCPQPVWGCLTLLESHILWHIFVTVTQWWATLNGTGSPKEPT